jgi:hypothetical protein
VAGCKVGWGCSVNKEAPCAWLTRSPVLWISDLPLHFTLSATAERSPSHCERARAGSSGPRADGRAPQGLSPPPAAGPLGLLLAYLLFVLVCCRASATVASYQGCLGSLPVACCRVGPAQPPEPPAVSIFKIQVGHGASVGGTSPPSPDSSLFGRSSALDLDVTSTGSRPLTHDLTAVKRHGACAAAFRLATRKTKTIADSRLRLGAISCR